MLDLSFIITIGLIFLAALLGAYFRSMVKDRCLENWEGFHITLEMANGKLIWGVLHLETSGMELGYETTVQDEKHIESSYLLYNSEFKDIQALYRYADSLSEERKLRRARDVERSFHPGPIARLGRGLRIFLGTATDSLNEVIGVVLGRVQKSGGRYLSTQGTTALGKLGGQVVGQAGTTYDPLLERYIGQRVVAELAEGNEVHEHVGVFKNYSTDFIEILDVQYPQRQTLTLDADGSYHSDRVAVVHRDGRLEVSNHDDWPILVVSVMTGDQEEHINAVVDTGETLELHLAQPAAAQPKLNLQVVRELDMILPRHRAVVRHRAEAGEHATLSDALIGIVFDVGLALSGDDAEQAREIRLRDELKRNPLDALASANLGRHLLQQGKLREAETFLRQALAAPYSLPDGGRRVTMELKEVERRLWVEGGHLTALPDARPPIL